MQIPTDRRYTPSHEYVRLNGTEATIGVTAYAAEQLGDIVFVELPIIGKELKKGEGLGVVESVKAVSDIFSPLSGKVVAINDKLESEPSLINDDPFGEGWIIKMEASNPAELDQVLTPDKYEELVAASH
ncbi:MAG TPA: glycine cleavage system protein GcvH [Cyanobacteria bacterium UBA8530]|nr:glycine cleavage system protein GcvH [Cyanobacteria bacterium UBA8530]